MTVVLTRACSDYMLGQSKLERMAREVLGELESSEKFRFKYPVDILRMVSVSVRDNKVSYAQYSRKLVVLGMYLLKQDRDYIRYVIAHEYCHILNRYFGGVQHDRSFKGIEKDAMDVIGVILDFGPRKRGRSKKYPRKVFNKKVLLEKVLEEIRKREEN